MKPLDIIKKFYSPEDPLYRVLVRHCELVAERALRIAARVPELSPDHGFVEEAAMLHDIGIGRTRAPSIHCHGDAPYLCHGVIGREMLEAEGLPRHALVCERHVGVGLTSAEIESKRLPLPARDMLPETTEEKIVCLADKFFSKRPEQLEVEKSATEVIGDLQRFGEDKVERFRALCGLLKEPLP